ncbi:MAG: peptidylprolyl isomerase [Ruminococcaceae bacterium]|nr:peptidylprolyl isomerase [Oscillospiraceae bacterium]
MKKFGFKKLFKLTMFCLVFAMTLSMLSCGSEQLLSGMHYAEMEIENYGTIKLELNADEAPITVTNFVNLAKSGFYDGLSIIRVDTDFVIQGGDGGTERPAKNIKGEFAANGVENNISHVKGTISMARGDDMNSASSQFFIMSADFTGLDGMYAGFGKVIEGMEVVDKINAEVKSEYDMGFLPEDAQPKIVSVKIVE